MSPRLNPAQRLTLLRRRSWHADRRRAAARVLLLPLAGSLALAACAAGSRGDGWLGLTPSAAAAAGPDAGGETAAGSYLMGRHALDSGDYRQAAQSFARALDANPEDIELRRQVFALLVAGGELDRAAAMAAELVEIDPGADEASMLLALDAARRGDEAAAAARLEGLGSAGLPGTVRPILLAWARFGAGDPEAAMRTLEAPDARGGLDRLHAYHRAVMLGLIGRAQEGRELLRATFGDPATAPPRVVRAAAALELAAGDRAAAEAVLEQALAADPDDPQLAALVEAVRAGHELGGIRTAADGMNDALVEVAEALSEQEGAAQALLYARLASFVRPEDPGAWLVIAAVALRQDNPEEALRALDRVAPDSPEARQAGFTRARALDALGRTDEAVALLRQMTDEAPARYDAPVVLGDLLRGKERYAEAETAYSEAIARLPRIEPRHWRLLYARGIAYERTDRWPQAEADLLEALELEPDQPFVLNYLGYSWVDQHLNLERAKGMLHRAVELRPEDGFIVDSLGWAYYRLGEHDKAVTYLERAVELEPGDPVINDHLGDAYFRVGRTREARFQWGRALTFKPEPELATAIREKLATGGLPDGAAPRRG